MYTNDRDAYRQSFFVVWDKYKKKLPLDAVETQLLDIILLHPEYHGLLDHPSSFQTQEFQLEENPFFHMSLHLALREQIRTQRPAGITAIYQSLLKKMNAHEAEHRMMQCLAQVMWKAQQTGIPPSETDYLEKLKQL